MIEYEPLLGDSIEHVVWRAYSLACDKKDTVTFNMCGKEMFIDQESDPAEVIKSFRFEADADMAAHRLTNASATNIKTDAESEQRRCLRVEELLGSMASSFSEGPQATLRWLEAFRASQGGDPDERRKIAKDLKDRGWIASDAIGLSADEYQDQDILARYLVGQFIDYLEIGQLPTDTIAPWVATYLKIKEQSQMEESPSKP